MTHLLGGESFLKRYLAQIERMASVLGGIPVWEVFPESAAAAAGLAFGDIVLSINGAPTPTFADFLAAGERYRDGLEFEVFRNGKRLRLRAEASATTKPPQSTSTN